jgi:3-deoxy-D-manno-octulosonic-acid transferase
MYLATPFFLLHQAFRGLRNPIYLRRWQQRFGWFKAPDHGSGIIVHAASVGEVNAASPLIRALVQRYGEQMITVTAFTATGSDQVTNLFGDSVFHRYAPLDLPGAVSRFFERLQPRLLVIMETEVWPNLYSEAQKRRIPVLVANARLSARSVRGYRRLGSLTRTALASVSHFAAQSETDAGRLLVCGADPASVVVSGNLKFDLSLPAHLSEEGNTMRRQWGEKRPVLLAGSTHEGEDEQVLAAFGRLLERFPEALLILVPRHPERFTRVTALARSTGLRTARHSEGVAVAADSQCLVIDTMGQLLNYYAACDIAFVGGSLLPVGGHNVLEPAALARPVIVGPHTFNFEDIVDQLVESGGAKEVGDANDLGDLVLSLFEQPAERDRMGQAGLELVATGRGALSRTLDAIGQLLEQAET